MEKERQRIESFRGLTDDQILHIYPVDSQVIIDENEQIPKKMKINIVEFAHVRSFEGPYLAPEVMDEVMSAYNYADFYDYNRKSMLWKIYDAKTQVLDESEHEITIPVEISSEDSYDMDSSGEIQVEIEEFTDAENSWD